MKTYFDWINEDIDSDDNSSGYELRDVFITYLNSESKEIQKISSLLVEAIGVAEDYVSKIMTRDLSKDISITSENIGDLILEDTNDLGEYSITDYSMERFCFYYAIEQIASKLEGDNQIKWNKII